MKKAFLFFLILSFSLTAFPQEKPLTQTEYVKMLYALDKDFGTRAGVVEALRRRGIDFVVTDGLRSLTRSKGRNDDELKRAFEEAGRRRSGKKRLPEWGSRTCGGYAFPSTNLIIRGIT